MVWGAFSAAGTGELLHCEKSINALEYWRILQKGLLPTIEKLFSKEEQSDVIFNKTMLLSTLQRPPKCGLRSQAHDLARSESRFGPYREYLVSN